MGLSIKISWPVHPLHCIGKNVLLPPRPNEKLEIEKMKLPLKKGIFSQAEDKLIQRNWIDFCKVRCFLRLRNTIIRKCMIIYFLGLRLRCNSLIMAMFYLILDS